MKSFPELLPDAVLGFEHAEDERVLLWLLGSKMGSDNGDPLLRFIIFWGECGQGFIKFRHRSCGCRGARGSGGRFKDISEP